ncbi:hypothetical protein ISU10_12160 [Nocardioides agariphilus]|uniref:Uncharacterized protein n=1 Tax=Nocardioides agariphilus TaxID=433664 RepID=A0A930VJ48_9ACTN|nr:hypothetical protein [Nocardioides agariphilus]MBF4768519.1 hypothetical protein [Nocardioides agariphilus]
MTITVGLLNGRDGVLAGPQACRDGSHDEKTGERGTHDGYAAAPPPSRMPAAEQVIDGGLGVRYVVS